jgi:UDP-glucose 4-epimerase
MKRVFVTGAAGFIGSTLVDRLLSLGLQVTGWDNFSTGFRPFLAGALADPRFTLIEGDLLDGDGLAAAMAGHDVVFHLAANADVRFGTSHPRKDLEQNTIATSNVLEAMRQGGVGTIAFASTGSIYGVARIVPTPEDAPFPVQTSLYGASKLAAEGLIAAYAEGFGIRGHIFRFTSILGPRYTHGHIFDFVRSLRADPASLAVLGDGTQTKSYLYVDDCIDAMLLSLAKASARVNLFNLGVDGTVRVTDSIRVITERLGVGPRLAFSGGDRGWIGDNPLIHLDISRIRALGWEPRVSIEDGIRRTVDWLVENPWVFEQRS